MAGKVTGLGANFYIDQYDISNDIASVDRIGSSRATHDVTGIDKSAHERVHALRDGGIDFTTHFNIDALRQHVALKGIPSTDRIVTYAHRPTIGAPAASQVSKQTDYAPTRADDGKMSFNVPAVSNGYGLEWGQLLTAGPRTDTTATAGTAFDFTASSSFGLQAYLHVFAFTGTSVTVKIQESSDNAGDAYADVVGGTFTVVSAVGAQRIATATNLSVERYLKVTTTGTFSNAQFAVSVVRNGAIPYF